MLTVRRNWVSDTCGRLRGVSDCMASTCAAANASIVTIGALGTSITFGDELEGHVGSRAARPHVKAWPAVLHSLLQRNWPNVEVVNMASARGASADYATLCLDHLVREQRMSQRALDIAIIEFASPQAELVALVRLLQSRGIAVVALIYSSPANPYRIGRIANDSTPWRKAAALSAKRNVKLAKLFRDLGVTS